jgi:hypothetical protein
MSREFTLEEKMCHHFRIGVAKLTNPAFGLTPLLQPIGHRNPDLNDEPRKLLALGVAHGIQTAGVILVDVMLRN